MELRNRYAVFISLIALLAGLIIALRVSSYSFLRLKYLPSSELLLKANLGHKNTLADYYFLNAIQYGGEPKNKDEEYRWLYPMLNIVTELDPKYGTPYRWGGIVLPFFNGTEWKNVQESDMLLEKGIRDARKDEDKYWQVHFYRGWNAMTYEKDYRKAGDYMAMDQGM